MEEEQKELRELMLFSSVVGWVFSPPTNNAKHYVITREMKFELLICIFQNSLEIQDPRHWRNNKRHPNHGSCNKLVKEKKLVQKEGMTCHCKWQHCEFKKILLSGPYSKGKALKYSTIKCGDMAQWGDVVQCSHTNRMQERVMQTERACEPVFAIKTSSRRALGGNPRTNSI